MTDRELRKLRRVDLLELLAQVSREKEALQDQVAALQAQLAERQLNLDRAGTMAEASLRLSGVFADIDAAGAQYLYNIQQLSQERTAACERLEAETRAQADAILAEAQAKADAILAQAQSQADAYWADVSVRLQRFYDEHPGLRSALEQK